jgi:hypothetical protein
MCYWLIRVLDLLYIDRDCPRYDIFNREKSRCTVPVKGQRSTNRWEAVLSVLIPRRLSLITDQVGVVALVVKAMVIWQG